MARFRRTRRRSWSANGGAAVASDGEALRRASGIRIDLITRSGDYYLALGARPIPGFRLEREAIE